MRKGGSMRIIIGSVMTNWLLSRWGAYDNRMAYVLSLQRLDHIVVLLLYGSLIVEERPDLVRQSLVVTPFICTLFRGSRSESKRLHVWKNLRE